MKITSINRQIRNSNRFNIAVDGKYLFSLDEFQLIELGIRKDFEYDESQINSFVEASEFGKIYSKTLEYCFSRPHSSLEVKRYLFRKTLTTIDKNGNKKTGINKDVAERVFDRLVEKGYIDDRKFAKFWIDNRFIKKGISNKRMKLELQSKGVERSIIEDLLSRCDRDDKSELKKIIEKKRSKYDDDKLKAYLIRQGFRYDDINDMLN